MAILTSRCFIICLALVSVGCTHFSSNKRACEKADPLLPLPYSFIGNIFQVGPCASIEPFRIETGVEIDRLRGGVEEAVQKEVPSRPLEQFAERMGCDSAVHSKFLEVLIVNKIDVFGQEYKNSNREVVKKVRLLTKNDPELKSGCW